MGRKLYDAWTGEDHTKASRVAEKALTHANGSEVVNAAARLATSAGRYIEFNSWMLDEASTMVLKLDNEPTRAGTLGSARLFAFVVHGTRRSIAALTATAALDGLARAIVTSGYAHQASKVSLCEVPLDPRQAVAANPVGVRRLADGITSWSLGEPEEHGKAASGVSHDDRDDGDQEAAVTRIIVGTRLLEATDATCVDLFFDAGFDYGESATVVTEGAVAEHENNRARAAEKIGEAIEEILEDADAELIIEGPMDWRDAFGTVACMEAQFGLQRLDQAAGRDADEGGAVGHVHFGATKCLVGMTLRNRRVGPVAIHPMVAAMGMEEMVGWMRGAFKDVVRHDMPESLEAQMQRHLH